MSSILVLETLIIQEIIKSTPQESYPFMDELRQGLAVVKRITDRVNEQKRREDNKILKGNLAEWVSDWKVCVYLFIPTA